MQQRPVGKLTVAHLVTNIPRLLLNPNVHYRVHRSMPIDILRKINPIHTHPPSFLKINFNGYYSPIHEPGSSGSIVSGYGLDDRAIEVRSRGGGQRIFLVASVSRPALGPTQPPVQWVPGVPSPGLKRGRGVTLTTHPYLVPRSRMRRSYTSSPPKRLHGV
jgi:hypothetical protein